MYQLHPRARYNPLRSALCLALLWVWSARLTHSYFRREEWKFGQVCECAAVLVLVF